MYLFSKGLRLEIRVLKFNKDILPPMMFYYLELYSGIGGGRMRIAVIGGTGFIATYIVERLIELGHNVLVFSRHDVNTPQVESLIGDKPLWSGWLL
ncbi:NAD-dependent epimerase/dehydratase family protein [Alicyclobacillus fodiniaquatilis]|uniref:NAD-dependent epimerase/dehydratase family protein n=1 Tax=Alicyclobacillus fodiniaquatilis TaxID=1661150 RepID=A0ABW4JDN0_9BACL